MRILLRRKGNMSLSLTMINEEKHTESIEMEKWLKKEIGNFLHAGKEMLLVDSKDRSSGQNHSF